MKIRSRSQSQTPQKHVRRSEIINTPTKLLVETGLLAGKSTPEQVEYIDDWQESIQKENSNNNSPHGSEIYSLSRKHDRLKKLIGNTPSKLAATSPLVNDALASYENISSSSASEDDDDDEISPMVEETTKGEQYFANARKKTLTSNNTLNFIAQSRQEYLDNLKKAPSHHEKHFKALKDLFKHGYGQWKFELEQGFNLMFYGFGSKREILTEFVDTLDGPVITLNGYFPTISFRAFMAAIVNNLMPEVSTLGSLANQCDLIHDYVDNIRGYITLLIHNIEGPGLVKPEVYSTLAKLASHCRIYTIVSSDHINTPLLFDMNLMTNFNFLWHDITNYAPYLVETSFENLICDVGGENGASYVLRSLTDSTKRLFTLLCKHQLALSLPNDKVHDSSSGLSFDALYTKAQKNFITQERGSFRIMLTEFRDHGLIVGEMRDGVELLYVPFSNDTINELLE